ncbi:MAG: hypothetical protein GY940_34875 [bacterium]|nr:hypothetical protein [bacterium]
MNNRHSIRHSIRHPIRLRIRRLRLRIPLFFLMIFLSHVPSPGLFSQSEFVEFVKAIDLKNLRGKKNFGSFLLGKKKQSAIIPGSICLLGDRFLCLTDSVNGAVIILDKTGKIEKRITRVNRRRLVSPVSACTDDKNHLYISDSALRAVFQFQARGKFKFKKIFAAPPNSRITGIAFLNGKLYCVDTQNHRILCFNRDGSLEFSFGKRGTGTVEFNFPTHITAAGGYLYITDAMNFRVRVFDGTGKYIRGFGKIGRGGGNFSKPKGLAVDSKHRIFVADAMFDNVQIFNTQGEFLSFFGGPGHRDGEFWMPSDVVTDKDNLIWVTDSYNSRVQVFKVQKETP